MNCEVCGEKLKAANNLGFCRRHRSHSPKTKARIDLWKQKNREHLRKYKKAYADKYREKSNLLSRIRLKKDVNAKLAHSLRTRLNRGLKGVRKEGSTKDLLGCSFSDLRVHLEGKFRPGMRWENHGVKGWHIDHIKPLASFDLTDKKQLKQACHYSNLQPLWYFENSIKRSRIESSQECPTTVFG